MSTAARDSFFTCRPAPGANNGASGVAVLLELARTLDVDESGHTLCLAFFDADANDGLPGWQGRLGSSHFARTVAQDVPRCAAPAFVVALDQVGGDNARFRQDANGDPALNAAIWAQGAAELRTAGRVPASRLLPAGLRSNHNR